MTVSLRRATEADIPFIMKTERGPGFDRVVGRWEAAAHRAEMAKAGSAYFIGESAGEPAGFALLQHLDDANGRVLLKRVAVTEPGRGIGRVLLVALLAQSSPSHG